MRKAGNKVLVVAILASFGWSTGLGLAQESDVGLRSSGFGGVFINPRPGPLLDREITLPICQSEPRREGPVPCPASVDRVHLDINYGKPRYRGRVRITVRHLDASSQVQWVSSGIFRVEGGDLFTSVEGPGALVPRDRLEITFTLLRPRLRKLLEGDRVSLGGDVDRRWR